MRTLAAALRTLAADLLIALVVSFDRNTSFGGLTQLPKVSGGVAAQTLPVSLASITIIGTPYTRPRRLVLDVSDIAGGVAEGIGSHEVLRRAEGAD